MKSSTLALALAAALGVAWIGAGAAWSQDKDKIVTERQDVMKKQYRELVAIRNYAQDKGEQAAAMAAIESLKKSVPTVPDHFPAGTGIGQVTVKTAAKPEIWSQHEKFLADTKTVIGQIAMLDAAVKGGDKPKIEALVKEIGSCRACHDTFRAKSE